MRDNMKKITAKITYLLAAVFISAGLLVPALAPTVSAASCSDTRGILGLPTWWGGLKCEDGKPVVENPIQIWKIVLNVIEAAMIIAGYVAVGYVIWGGFKYLTSDGDEGRLTMARKIIQNALIGLAIVFASVAMVNFVAGLI